MQIENKTRSVGARLLTAVSLTAAIATAAQTLSAQTTVSAKNMKQVGEVDPRFVSYNVEAVEVTGGRFWAPFKTMTTPAKPPAAAGLNLNSKDDPRFRYRAPIDLSNPKLRNLAGALGPAFVRVSGTWRNATYFQNDDAAAQPKAPAGFDNVMTRAEWKGVVDFAKAVHGDIVASVTTSAGVRDKDGVWTPTQAQAWFNYTRSIGGSFAAMEFMNEPTLLGLAGMPSKYGADDYGRDSKVFGAFLKQASPGTLYLGPGSAAEGQPMPEAVSKYLKITPSDSLLKATGPLYDGFSYHVYYSLSRRCVATGGVQENALLESDWFARGETVEQFYSRLRDEYLPGKPLWLTETGEASCGGDKWASTFVDSFRLLDQFGDIAQHSVQSVMINTLASSDYGMLDENTLDPRPNYWAALLWKRTMGTKSLDPGVTAPGLRVYAQCQKNTPGGVAVLVLNIDKAAHELTIPTRGEKYVLSAPELFGTSVSLNGKKLEAAADGTVPAFRGDKTTAGRISFAPETITVLTLPSANNSVCK